MHKIRIWNYKAIAKGPEVRGTIQSVPDSAARRGESPAKWGLRMLLRHLQALAADGDTLLRAYPSRAHAVDEVVNDFSSYLQMAKKAAEEGLVTNAMLDKARAVEDQITEMSKKSSPSLWNEQGLRKRREWVVVRQLSAEALKALGYDVEPPPPLSM